MRTLLAACLLALVATAPLSAAKKDRAKPEDKSSESKLTAGTFTGLAFRSVGPAFTSGRVSDVAVDPTDHQRVFVAAASGGVWRTENGGTTWTPVFDDQGSYSIGAVAIDPSDPDVVWVGTGENNSQRSVSYGDGVYRSLDGGKSWKRVGLDDSQHIGKILIDPEDTRIVYVAAQGPLWNAGGDRGLYKSTDRGESWEKVLEISDDTGVTDVVMDPRDPEVLIAASYQRRRHVWTLIDGGPESAIYKSTDAGESWWKVTSGLPTEEMGRIGLAVSPADPEVVFAIIEAAGDAGGFFRSTDFGESWEKRSGYVSGGPQYYQEIIADPADVDRVYSMDTWMQVTEDGGKTFHNVGELTKHVDNHALWIDPGDTDHLLAGCDGGLYETRDRGATWRFFANLPVTQFYRVSVDNDTPFYNLYGGTQDNFSLGGPSRTSNIQGIRNSDWFVTLGGDGFESQVDPEDPDTIYAQLQYGVLVRFDKRSGQQVLIQPQAGKDEPPLRWNWNSPLLISPHSHTRLYFAANRLFRSDDRGQSWRSVSPDLTRQLDRNALEVMGKVWPPEAVAKSSSTSFWGNIVSISESPVVEDLLYVGTDDGLVQVSADGGATWQRHEKFPGVPDMSYVSDLEASLFDPDTVFASFDNHKQGDFHPYLLRSTDRGATWTSIAGDLPERGSVHTVIQDHVKPELLFAGTEFGVFFTVDGGGHWVQLKGGLPVVAVRDLDIQRRESDLVAATFGRGFYVLDDYSPLRQVSEELLESDTPRLFPVKTAPMYIEGAPLGLPGKSFQGDAFFVAPNPPFGAVFTYYLKDAVQTRKEKRKDEEKEKGEELAYPSWEELRAEAREEEPGIILTVTDPEGNVVRRLTGPVSPGFHRVAWDLRYPPSDPIDLSAPGEYNPFVSQPRGPMAVPGSYRVSLAERVDGKVTPIGEPQEVVTESLGLATLPTDDRQALLAFQEKTARLQRAVFGAVRAAGEIEERIRYLEAAVMKTPGADISLVGQLRALHDELRDLQIELTGDPVKAAHNEPSPASIAERVQTVIFTHWDATAAPTGTAEEAYAIAAADFDRVLGALRTLRNDKLAAIEDQLEEAGAPWTPGRLPDWQQE